MCILYDLMQPIKGGNYNLRKTQIYLELSLLK